MTTGTPPASPHAPADPATPAAPPVGGGPVRLSDVPTPAPVARLTVRTFAVPSCSLNALDLRVLHTMLMRVAREAADRQVPILVRQETESPDQFSDRVLRVRAMLELVVGVHGPRGELVGGTAPSVLDAEQLPVSLVRIDFDSAFHFRAQGLDPLNQFKVTLDFRRARVFEGLFSIPEETNESTVEISGQDTTWVNGVATEARDFFVDRTARRDWLHMPQSYGVAALAGILLSLYWVYWIDRWPIISTLAIPEALKVTLYVYIVLIIMSVYRVTFNVARRTFPKIEGPERHTPNIWLQRTPLGVLVAGLLANVLFEIGRALLRLLGRE